MPCVHKTIDNNCVYTNVSCKLVIIGSWDLDSYEIISQLG